MHATLTRVQSKVDQLTTSITLTTAPLNGHSLFAIIATRASPSITPTGIAETGATWSKQAQTLGTGSSVGGFDIEIWAAFNVQSASASLTISLSGTGAFTWSILEYSGIATSSALDKTASHQSSVPALTGDTGTTTTTTIANELWLGGVFFAGGGSATSADSGFTLLGGSAVFAGLGVVEKIVGSTGTAGCQVTLSSSDDSLGVMATFKTVSSDFSFSLSPTAISAPPTGTSTLTITVTNITGTAEVTFSCPSGLPSGASCGFTNNGNPAPFTSTLTVTTSSSSVGTYTVTVQGANSTYGVTHTATFTLTVSNTIILTNSGDIGLIAGSSGSTTVTVTEYSSLYTQLTVSLGLPSGAMATFGPASATGNYTATLTIATLNTLVGGTYTLVISNATIGGPTTSLHLKVLDFSPSTVSNAQVSQDSSATYSNWLTVTSASVGSPSASITSAFSGAPSGVTFTSLGPSSIPGTIQYDLQVVATNITSTGTYAITLTISGANQVHSVYFALTVISPTTTFTTQFTTTISSTNTAWTTTVKLTSTTTSIAAGTIVATLTQTLEKYTVTDSAMVIYGLAFFCVLTPTLIVLTRSKQLAGLLIAMSAGLTWAVMAGVLPVQALLLLVAVGVIAVIFRLRG